MERQLAAADAGDDKSPDRSQSITNPNYCGPEEEEAPGVVVQQMQCLDEGALVILYCNRDFMCSCSGVTRLFQVVSILLLTGLMYKFVNSFHHVPCVPYLIINTE
jgi:hypothetical protein